MGSFDPDFGGAVTDLDARLQEKTVELQALKAKYDQLGHRFRDSLDTLSSLFAAQARQTIQPELCRKCISCLMGVHGVDELASERVSMNAYLSSLTRALLGGLDGRVRLATSVDPGLQVDFRRASCIGFIYAEAVTNAFKHAFPGLASGAIYATLRGYDRRLEMTIVDCGLGFDPEKAVGLGDGLNFMRGLARQIDGELTIRTSAAGTMVFFSCPA